MKIQIKTAFCMTIACLTLSQQPSLAAQALDRTKLSLEDRRILDRGEIDESRATWSGVVGTVAGFGVGHAMQGRYRDEGWKFTAIEGAGVGIFYTGLLSCFGDSATGTNSCPIRTPFILAGLGVYLVGHIWEIIDVWSGPSKVNRRYHELRGEPTADRGHLMVAPIVVHSSPGVGVAYSF